MNKLYSRQGKSNQTGLQNRKCDYQFKLQTPQTEDENLKGAFREYLEWDEEYDLASKSYKSETDSEFNDESILIEDEPSFHSEDDENPEDFERRITTQRGSEAHGMFRKFINSGIKAVKYLISGKKVELDRTDYKLRKSRHSKYAPKAVVRTYKYLRQKGTTKLTKKNVPRWAVNKDYLSKFSSYIKANYSPENVLGEFISMQNNICVSKMFDYQTKQKKNSVAKSKYFQNQTDNYIDPIDIRGSSAQWNNAHITAEHRFKVPSNFFKEGSDSISKENYLKEKIHNQIKKKIEFPELSKLSKPDTDDMDID